MPQRRHRHDTERITLAYLRLSLADDDGKDESNSISSQRECIRDYCQRHGIRQEGRECVDDGYSGTDFNRPGFQELMHMVKTGSVDTIIVKDLSRLGRNYLETGYYLEYVFPYYGVRVISVNDHYDSKESGETTIGLDTAIRNLMNECYSRDISKKISSAVHLKKAGGEYVYGAVPFGYKKGERKNTIVVDDEAADIVRRIFQLAADGNTVTQIARLLNEEKVITPSKYLAPVRPNYKVREFWSYESVRNILINRIYTGDTETYKSHVVKVGSDRVKQIPEKERVVIEDTHEALVSRELYAEARAVIKSNVKGPKKKAGSVFTGMLYCSCCGGRLVKGKAENRRFLCANARYCPDSGCVFVKIEEAGLKDTVSKEISKKIEMLREREKEIRQLVSKGRSEILQLQRERDRTANKRKRLMDDRIRLYEDYAEGKLDKEMYLDRKQEIATLDEKYASQEQVLDEKIQNLQKDGNERAEQAGGKRMETCPGQELTKEILQSLVSRIVVSPGGEAEIYWK